MTALQLNAELYRAMGKIADDETLMTKEEFFKRIDESRAQYERGEYTRINSEAELKAFLNSF